MSATQPPILLELELEPGRQPIVGRVRDERGETEAFSGWMALISVVQERCGIAPETMARPPERSAPF